MQLLRSGENYLKTILILQKQNAAVRSLDVADHLHFSRASVCRAIKLLQEGGFLTMEEDKTLHLTPMGQQAAESVFTRHAVLNEALLAIDVTPETARRDACEIEHVISEETFTRVKAFLSRQRGGRDRAETPKEDEDGRDQNNAEDRGNVLRDVRGAHLRRDPQDAPLREEGLRLPPEG